MKSGGTVRCFFDINIDDVPSGRIMFELFNNICPKTCENFRALCTGEAGLGKITNKPLHYEGVKFHRIIKDFMVQAGDFSAGNGTGGESIYGGCFDDENFDIPHDTPFLLSMANRGRNTNGSQFFITTQPAHHLDSKHVVFGRVVSGQDVVVAMEELPVDNRHRPLNSVAIARCGELLTRAKGKDKKKSKKKVVVAESESDSDEEEVKKKKKKKKDKKKKKKSKKSKKAKHQSSEFEGSEEEGEVLEEDEGDDVDPRFRQQPLHLHERLLPLKRPHPSSGLAPMAAGPTYRTNLLVQVSHINPDEIPDVPKNRFLFRGAPSGDRDDPKAAALRGGVENGRPRDRLERDGREYGGGREYDDRGRPRGREPLGRKKVKGRGAVRYLPPAARSRTPTPPHWRQEQRRTVPLEIYQRRTERLMEREAEMEERKMKREERHRQAALKSRKQLQGGEEGEVLPSDEEEEEEEGLEEEEEEECEEPAPAPKKSRKAEKGGLEGVKRTEIVEEDWTAGKKRSNLDGDWRKARKETRESREDEDRNVGEGEHRRKKRRSSKGEPKGGDGERKDGGSDKKAEKVKEKGAFEHNSDDSEDDLKEEDLTTGDLNKILDYGDDNALDYDPIEEDEEEKEEVCSRPASAEKEEDDSDRLKESRGRKEDPSKSNGVDLPARGVEGKEDEESSSDDAGESDTNKGKRKPSQTKYDEDGDAEMSDQDGGDKPADIAETKAKVSSEDEPTKKESHEGSKVSKAGRDVVEALDDVKASKHQELGKERNQKDDTASRRRSGGDSKGDSSSDKKASDAVIAKTSNGSKRDESEDDERAAAKPATKDTIKSPLKSRRSSGDHRSGAGREGRAASRDKARGSRDRSDRSKRDKDPVNETSAVAAAGTSKGETVRPKDSKRKGEDSSTSRRRSRSRSRHRGSNKRRSSSRSRRVKSRSKSRGKRSRTPEKTTRGRRSRSRSDDKSRSRRRRSRSRTAEKPRGGRKVSRSRSRGKRSRSNDKSRRHRSRSSNRRRSSDKQASKSKTSRGGGRRGRSSSSESSSSSSSAVSTKKKSSSDSD